MARINRLTSGRQLLGLPERPLDQGPGNAGSGVVVARSPNEDEAHIEPGIRQLVAMVRSAGHLTYSSCEGHLAAESGPLFAHVSYLRARPDRDTVLDTVMAAGVANLAVMVDQMPVTCDDLGQLPATTLWLLPGPSMAENAYAAAVVMVGALLEQCD